MLRLAQQITILTREIKNLTRKMNKSRMFVRKYIPFMILNKMYIRIYMKIMFKIVFKIIFNFSIFIRRKKTGYSLSICKKALRKISNSIFLLEFQACKCFRMTIWREKKWKIAWLENRFHPLHTKCIKLFSPNDQFISPNSAKVKS